jgi:hypothetical protein
VDERTGDGLVYTEQEIAASLDGLPIQADSSYATVEPRDSVVSLRRTDYMVGSTLVAGQSWGEAREVSLPRVLTSLTPVAFDDTDGNTIFTGVWHYLTNYSSVYVVNVTEKWYQSVGSNTYQVLRPEALSWITPFGEGYIQECLHPMVEITGNTASDGSTPAGGGRFYAYIAWDFVFPATTPSALSGETIYLLDSYRPEKGGFIRRTESVTVP